MHNSCAFCGASNARDGGIGYVQGNGICVDCNKLRRKFAVSLAANNAIAAELFTGPPTGHDDEDRIRLADNLYKLAEALTKRDLE
jgi:hypothetical protein